MAPFNKGGYKGGNGGQGGFRGGNDRPRFGANKGGFDRGGRDDRPTQMFAATCAECGKACEVPFRPNGEKPVFCRDCFGDKRGNQAEYGRREAPAHVPAPRDRDFAPRREFNAPSHHDHKPAVVEDKRIDELKRQIDAAHKKLDSVIEMIRDLAVSIPAPKAAAPVVTKQAAPVVAKAPVAAKTSLNTKAPVTKVAPKGKTLATVVKKVAAKKKSPAKK